MGLREWNRVRHPIESEPVESENDEVVPVESAPGEWNRGDIILGTWQDAAEYAHNVRLLQERGFTSRTEDEDDEFMRRLSMEASNRRVFGGSGKPSRFGNLSLKETREMER